MFYVTMLLCGNGASICMRSYSCFVKVRLKEKKILKSSDINITLADNKAISFRDPQGFNCESG